MKLSLSLIKERLGNSVIQENFNNSGVKLSLSRPVLYTGENVFNSDTLYISHAENLVNNPELMNGSSLICISPPPINYFSENLNLLVIDKTMDIFSLSNKVHRIFDLFELWDENLKQSLNELNPFQYILNISEEIFGNGLSIMDSNFYIVAETLLNISAAGYTHNLDEYGRLPIEQVNSFKNDKIYMEISRERDVFHYPDEILPYNCICKNIFLNDEFVYRLIISETNHKFNNSDVCLLDYMSEYMEQISFHILSNHKEEDSILATLLQNFISGKSYNKIEFDKELKKIGWNQNDTYRIIHIQPSSHDIYITTMSYFCIKIMKEFKQTFAFVNDNKIILIINIDKISESYAEYFSKFNYFIREANFRIGFSNNFIGLDDLKDFSLQAGIALEIGLLNNPTKWSHKFSDNILSYIFAKVTEELPVEFLLSPIITRLQESDSQNQTEYLKTLEVYLKNNMNAVQTAKDLYIHRATIIYRLERIKEIGKTDLKNNDELLHLKISFKLMNSNLE